MAADFTKMLRGRDEKANGRIRGFCLRVVLVVFVALLVAIGPLLWFSYVLGRVYLVVECFKNVANLPKAAFEVAPWSVYVPHIS